MSRLRVAQVGVAIVLVAGISGSTVWATQASSESAARSQVVRARAAAHAEVRHAAGIGLLPSELRGIRARMARQDAANAPMALPFWRSSVTQFYHRQSAAYQSITVATRRQEASVTRQTRSQAGASLNTLNADIATVNGLGLDTHAASALSGQQRSRLQAGPATPAVYRSIATTVSTAVSGLQAAIATRKTYVASLLTQSGNNVQNIYQRADVEHDTASRQAWLIGLVAPKSTNYTAALDRAVAAVHAQPAAAGAAAQEANLHDLAATVAATFKKSTPEKVIVVSTEDQSAQLFDNGTQVYSAPVTTGGPELPTDHGVFHIYLKASPFEFHSPWPIGSPYYYPPTPVQYWMPFDGAEGLHDASWRSNFGPGSNLAPTDLGTGNYILGTHGCVNLPTDAAAFVWDWAPVGTTVVVV